MQSNIPARLAGWVTRREGRKFLQLRDNPPEPQVPADKVGRDEGISLRPYPLLPLPVPLLLLQPLPLPRGPGPPLLHQPPERAGPLSRSEASRFSGVYFGGGTPTVLMDELSAFMTTSSKAAGQRGLPGDHPPRPHPRNIPLLQQAGVKRLSVGVQSFNRDTLKAMGRPQMDAARAERPPAAGPGPVRYPEYRPRVQLPRPVADDFEPTSRRSRTWASTRSPFTR